MDPLALAAVVGLVFAGKKLSEDDGQLSVPQPPTTRSLTRGDIDQMANARDHAKDAFEFKNMNPELGRRIGDIRINPKNTGIPSLQDMQPNANRFPNGEPVYNLYGREYISNKMNNLQPIERQRVGPGLGVGPNVAAAGGFHQYFRALPTNINEEKLTTLEGREGPAAHFIPSGGPGGLGEVTHEAKDTKTWYRPPAQTRAEGQGGAITKPEGRPEFNKTKRSTNRQQTGMRRDALENGPAQYNVYQPYGIGDMATDKALTRCNDFRGKKDREGNPGRMNVRDSPVNAGGAMTNLRPETVPFPVPPMNAGRFQNYVKEDFYRFGEKKGKCNPLGSARNLDVAIQQLEKNPVALPSLAVV